MENDMYFVTDEPKIFSLDSSNVVGLYQPTSDMWHVIMDTEGMRKEILPHVLCRGTRQECEDFIYSIAGTVKAKNPIAKELPIKEGELKPLGPGLIDVIASGANPVAKLTNQKKELVNFVKAARDIIDSGPVVSIDNELADDMVETANRILDGIA